MNIFQVDAKPWAARDDGGSLCLYDYEPEKQEDMFHCSAGSHLACRESDLFGDTSNSDAVKFLQSAAVNLNALIETLQLNPPGA